jgi:16S rRNA (cytosine967-C5)-methyltransferase
MSRTDLAPDGIRFFNPKLPLPEIPEFQKGWFQVQDEAAQLVSLLLDAKPDERILDACAGLGGKTGHIAQIMKNRGRITAMDRQQEKLNRLEQEMHRIGVTTVRAVCNDLFVPVNEERFGTYDRILLDAPCSGLGVLRRNPDTKWAATSESLKSNQERQVAFLDNLASLVRPSGVMVYSVCSNEPEETDDVATLFLKAHPEFAVDRIPEYLSKKNSLVDKNGCLNTLPHIHNTDGFFAVRFKRGI